MANAPQIVTVPRAEESPRPVPPHADYEPPVPANTRLATCILGPACAIILISFGIILSGAAPTWTRFLDNVHWTTAYIAAALLAWCGVAAAARGTLAPRRWFALGLTVQTLGQIAWDIQVSVGWNPFPGPSDLFFIFLGPCCAMGLWSALKAKTPRGRKLAMGLDAAAFSVAALAVMLALYLPRKGDMGTWPLTILLAYPVALLSAVSIGVVMLLTLRLRPDWRWLLFFVALIGISADWMHWNSLTLDNALEDGSWFNFSFSANTLAMGIGAMAWRIDSSSNHRWERICEGVLRLLPVVLVVVAAVSVVLVWTVPDVSRGVRASIGLGAVLVSLLAMARQSILLTERSRLLAAEHRIRESEGRYKTLFETAQDAIFIVDGLKFVDCNQSALRMLACTREQIVGHTPLDLSPDVQPDGRRSMDKAAEVVEAALAGSPQFFEWRLLRSDGTSLDTEVSLNRIELDGRVLLQAMVRDVSERKRAHIQLQRALEHEKELAREAQAGERAKSEFVAMMSHEIRTPMNGILGFAELMTHSPSLPADCREYLRNITTSGEALQRILDDILDFSRMEAGHLSIEKTAFQPAELVENIRFLFAHHALGKGLEFKTVVPDEIPRLVEGDAGRLRQILINLAGNALKFTERGSVTLGIRELSQPDGESALRLEFFVEDTGPGIPQEKLGRIFDLFTQADSAMSRRHGGTGLGLTIAKQLARLMGGDIRVESRLGEGSRFAAAIPLGIPPATAAPSPAPPPAPHDSDFAATHPLRILVVEDDNSNLKLILAMLRNLGYEPLMARNGAEAVQICAGEHPDGILMDIQMPEMDGIEATQKIREMEKAAATAPAFICALTANILPADRARCFDAGMNSYLNKPLKRDLLARALAEASAFVSGRR